MSEEKNPDPEKDKSTDDLESFLTNLDLDSLSDEDMMGLLDGQIDEISDEDLDLLLSKSQIEDDEEDLEVSEFMKDYKILGGEREEIDESLIASHEQDSAEEGVSSVAEEQESASGGKKSDEELLSELLAEMGGEPEGQADGGEDFDYLQDLSGSGPPAASEIPEDISVLGEFDEDGNPIEVSDSRISDIGAAYDAAMAEAKKRENKEKLSAFFANIKSFPSTIRKKLRKNAKLKMKLAICLMFVILVAAGIRLYFMYSDMKRLVEENKIIVKQNNTKRYNNGNFIFAYNEKMLNGRELVLTKLLLDENRTTFYFNSHLNMNTCYAELRDDTGRFYSYDESMLAPEPEIGVELEPTALWFDGYNDDANMLYLTVWDSVTKDSAEFEIDTTEYEPLTAKYLDIPKVTRTADERFNITVEGASFSSDSCELTYKIETTGGIEVVHGVNDIRRTLDLFQLENSDKTVLPLIKYPSIYRLDDSTTLGHVFFNPVQSLDKSATLIFKNLYKHFNIERTIPAAPLFENTAESQIVIDLDTEALVLERMRKMGENYVLVYHFEDKKTKERLRGLVDIKMYIETATGLKVYLPETIISGDMGGDILFRYESPNSIVENATESNVYIEVITADMEMEDIATQFQIPKFVSDMNKQTYEEQRTAITKAFKARLSVKAGKSDERELGNYFDSKTLEDAALIDLYSPMKSDTPVEYAVDVKTVCALSENEYFAIVDDSWLLTSGENKTYVYNTHHITIIQNGDNYVVTNDEVKTNSTD